MRVFSIKAGISQMFFAAIYAATWKSCGAILEKRQIHTGSVKDGPLLRHPVMPGDRGGFMPDRLEEQWGWETAAC